MKNILKRSTRRGKSLIQKYLNEFKGKPIVYSMKFIIYIYERFYQAKIIIHVLIYTLQVIVFSSEWLIQILKICLHAISSVISLFYCTFLKWRKYEISKLSTFSFAI